MNNCEIYKDGQYLTFTYDAGSCYGGVRERTIDTEGLTGKKLFKHIEEYLGIFFAKSAKEQGYCN